MNKPYQLHNKTFYGFTYLLCVGKYLGIYQLKGIKTFKTFFKKNEKCVKTIFTNLVKFLSLHIFYEKFCYEIVIIEVIQTKVAF